MDLNWLYLTCITLLVTLANVKGQQTLCPSVPLLNNGHQSESCSGSIEAGAICQFKCKQGFRLNGASFTTCLPNGKWDEIIPTCKEITCDNLPVPKNGLRKGACSDSTAPGGKCEFTCNEGFRLTGDKVSTCLSTGQWDQYIPFCIAITCKDITAPKNGVQTGSCSASSVQGGKCQFTCKEGFKLSGATVTTCKSNGQWDQAIPTCTEITCKSIPAPTNGLQSGSCSATSVRGGKCQFTCKEGFKLSGATFTTCQLNGQWDQAIPTCTEITCPTVSAPANGEIKGSCSKAVIGAKCNLDCRDGYTLNGVSVTTCQKDGKWDKTAPTCIENKCPALPVPKNGLQIGSCSNLSVQGGKCQFTCKEGFKLSGASVSTCQSSGKWDLATPSCTEITCKSLPVPTNGLQSGSCSDSSVRGGKCQFTCKEGFKLSGASFATCLSNGQWDQNIPSCTEITCKSLPIPTNGLQSGSCSASSVKGGKCQFTCKEGFKLSGTTITTCQSNGQWDQAIPSCTEITCASVSAPTNGQGTGSCSKAVIGGKCNFGCHDGFTINGVSVTNCQKDGKWDKAAPKCVENKCPALPVPKNALLSGSCTDSTVKGGKCQFTCKEGFKLSGAAFTTCQSTGKWDQAIPSCTEITCKSLPLPTNGLQSGLCSNSTVKGGKCQFTCKEGFKLNGASFATCQLNGQWDQAIPTCTEIICPTVSAPVNGEIKGSCSKAVIGAKCNLTCRDGYTLNGVSVTTCQKDGKWDKIAPTCIENKCPALPVPKNGLQSGSCSNLSVKGGKCQFTCKEGFKLNGATFTTCQSSGKWDLATPSCTEITCASITVPKNGLQTGSCSASSVKGGKCQFTCKEGFKLNGASSTTCQSNGQWDQKIPSCTEITCQSLPVPTNGVQSGSCSNSSVRGGKCQFKCQEGYKLIGVSFTTCQSDGYWDQNIPSCTAITCQSLPIPRNGLLSGSCSDSSVHGGKCQFTCKEGFKLSGATFTTCKSNGQWDQAIPTCTEITCPIVSTLANGEIKGSCSNALIGGNCSFACRDGYTLNGASVTTCQKNGMWDKPAPKCIDDVSTLKIVPRASWGAKVATNKVNLNTPVQRVFIHHTETITCKGPTACNNLIKGMQGYHMESNGWSDIGYSFLMDSDGVVYEGRGWKTIGPNTLNYNPVGIGLAFIGDYNRLEANSAQKKALNAFIAYGVRNNHIESDYHLNGHRDAFCTTSPGNALYAYIQTLPKFDKTLKASKCSFIFCANTNV